MITYKTFQDFEKVGGSSPNVIKDVINSWVTSETHHTAMIADEYDRQRNPFINNYVKTILSLTGEPLLDFTASNNKIASNFFHRLNKQRCTYSLGNGVFFAKDNIKNKFASDFDTVLKDAGYYALIHGISFIYTGDKQYLFKATEFAPLWDEETGKLRAGVKFWRLSPEKPLSAVLYEEDGYTKYQERNNDLVQISVKTQYKVNTNTTNAFGTEVVGYDNWGGALPIVPLFGNNLKQSTLIGMKEKIDCFDLVKSGFANDLSDITEIYWLVENYGGMTDDDLARFRDRIRINHIASIDTSQGGKVSPYRQEIPYQARKVFLDDIRNSIYEDFGALDVHIVAAGATNDHIDAAYQPMDENADDFEYQVIDCVQKIGQLLGIDNQDAIPQFKRNRISNQKEQTDMVLSAAQYLDDETILRHLPFLSVDEIDEIMKRKEAEEAERYENVEEVSANEIGDSDNTSGENAPADTEEMQVLRK